MNNFGFISKKKVASEIAKAYNGHNNTPCNKEQFLKDCEVQSALNLLCKRLNIKPMILIILVVEQVKWLIRQVSRNDEKEHGSTVQRKTYERGRQRTERGGYK